MAGRTKTSARNAATAATLRGMRAESSLEFSDLEQATGIKRAQLERLFRNQATFSIEDFTVIVSALGGSPAETLDRILAKVVGN